MSTKHKYIHDRVIAGLGGDGLPDLKEDASLPEHCPPEGLGSIAFEDPEFLEQVMGVDEGAKSYQRNVRIAFVVMGATAQQRTNQLDGFLKIVGAQIAALDIDGLDHVEVEGVEYEDEIDLDGEDPIEGAAVVAALYYLTNRNPLEAYNG